MHSEVEKDTKKYLLLIAWRSTNDCSNSIVRTCAFVVVTQPAANKRAEERERMLLREN